MNQSELDKIYSAANFDMVLLRRIIGYANADKPVDRPRLSRAMKISGQKIAASLRRLENKGYIRRESGNIHVLKGLDGNPWQPLPVRYENGIPVTICPTLPAVGYIREVPRGMVNRRTIIAAAAGEP